MALKSTGGSRAKYKNDGRHDLNKARDTVKLLKGLEQRKAWRIQKYKDKPQAELSRTTRVLFKKWGVELIGPKSVAKPVVHKRWGKAVAKND